MNCRLKLELASVHSALEQFQACKRIRQVQREVVMAHLALIHMPANEISLLELATKPEEAALFTRKRQKGQIQQPAAQSPMATSFAPSRGSALSQPIFTSRAKKESWKRQRGLTESGGNR